MGFTFKKKDFKMLSVITGRRVAKFSKKELIEMHVEIANMTESELEANWYQADNLPKWLWASGHCKRSKRSLLIKLLKLITSENQTIDVRIK
jgi:hypothetical protein